MERKLELADIAGYLPYGLKTIYIGFNHKKAKKDNAKVEDFSYNGCRVGMPLQFDDCMTLEQIDKYFTPKIGWIQNIAFRANGQIKFSVGGRRALTFWSHNLSIKPILRPMTDLTKPMTHPDINNGEEFVPIFELLNIAISNELTMFGDKVEVRNYFPSKEFELGAFATIKSDGGYLLFFSQGGFYLRYYDNGSKIVDIPTQKDMFNLLDKLHFDYNDLIGQGLAIDINQLKTTEQ